MKENIILIGFMGCGKTSVGKQLAQKLSYEFLDTDEEIEKRQKMTISKIFAEKGEEYFRELETQVLEEMLPTVKQTVISTGGGLPLREKNAKILKDLGVVIYLKATKETTLERVYMDRSRPILAGDNLEERIDNLLKTRAPSYEAAAHTEVVTDHRTYSSIITDILEFIRK